MSSSGKTLFFAVNVNDHVMKSRFVNGKGCRHSLNDDTIRVLYVMFGEKRALVCGHGDLEKGRNFALRDPYARVLIAVSNPICALKGVHGGFPGGSHVTPLSMGLETAGGVMTEPRP